MLIAIAGTWEVPTLTQGKKLGLTPPNKWLMKVSTVTNMINVLKKLCRYMRLNTKA